MIKNIIFDFDGVIHDTTEICLSLNEQVSGMNRADTERAFRGNVFDDKKIKKVPQEVFFNLSAPLYKPLITTERIKKFLTDYSDRRYFIVSSGDETIINDYLLRNGIKDLFVEVWGYNTHLSKHHKINVLFDTHQLDSKDTVFITDTLGDIHEGNQSGVQTIAVSFGMHNRETLEEGSPIAICSSWDEVQTVINQL